MFVMRAAFGAMAAIAALGFIAVLSITNAPARTPPPRVPVFERGELDVALDAGGFWTSLTFGPDGRLYVSSLGSIHALTLDDDTRDVLVQEEIATNLRSVLGLAFDPAASEDAIVLYASNLRPGEPAFRRGQVTAFAAPDWEASDVITGLPSTGGLEHQTNGLAFDDSGQLFIAQGSLSVWPDDTEGPLSAAILRADVHAESFDGNVTYDADLASNEMNQLSGDVDVHAPGLRNPYDVIQHTNGNLYTTDNGGTDSFDKINLIEEGSYYGFPNLNRCRFNPPGCSFVSIVEPSDGDYMAPIAEIPGGSNCNGLAEYTSDALDGLMQGDLLCGGWGSNELLWTHLAADGRSVEFVAVIASDLGSALDVAVGPDGTIYVINGNGITYLVPTGIAAELTPNPTPLATATPSPPPELKGDTDCDGAVTSIDGALVLQFVAGLTPELPCQVADVDGDGLMTTVDAALILQFVAGLIAGWPP